MTNSSATYTRLFLLVSLLFCSINLLAKDFNNGCGSDWNERVVPDSFFLLNVDFTEACSTHDNCYSKCLEGGENYGKDICKQTADEQREGRRLVCDNKFLDDLRRSCGADNVISTPACNGLATIFKVAVRLGGKGSFNGREVSDEYYKFLSSESAKDFDFVTFEKEIDTMLQQENIEQFNNLKIDVKNNQPVAKFISKSPIHKTAIEFKQGLYSTESLNYGNVDLSNAAIKNAPLELKDINTKLININKLKSERSFSDTKP